MHSKASFSREKFTLNLRSLIPFSAATELYISKIMSFALSPMAWIETLSMSKEKLLDTLGLFVLILDNRRKVP